MWIRNPGGRTLEEALDTLALLWADLFRVMDDIKESVRVAAGKAAQSLSRVSIKVIVKKTVKYFISDV
jgi:hypothetical protein